jgi:hypothetical protein
MRPYGRAQAPRRGTLLRAFLWGLRPQTPECLVFAVDGVGG